MRNANGSYGKFQELSQAKVAGGQDKLDSFGSSLELRICSICKRFLEEGFAFDFKHEANQYSVSTKYGLQRLPLLAVAGSDVIIDFDEFMNIHAALANAQITDYMRLTEEGRAVWQAVKTRIEDADDELNGADRLAEAVSILVKHNLG